MTRGSAIETARRYAPYLSESLERFPDISEAFLSGRSGDWLDENLQALPHDIEPLEKEMKKLRLLKRRCHLMIALLDIAKVWGWIDVTEYLTRIADLSMTRIMRAAALDAGLEGTPDNPVPGLFCLAVGKYGGRELNYSSDIDFNIFYDPEKLVLPRPERAERTLIRFAQSLIKGFDRITEDGYIFRTDLRLRPDPRSTSIVVSVNSADRYYQTLGQNWERAAMIKARVCGGDQETGQAFIEQVLSPFIWRKNLDYAAIEDILAMKRQMHVVKGGAEIRVKGHDLKTGLGGIREIEFFVQTQQLILGGRDPALRTPRTEGALNALHAADYVAADTAQRLSECYSRLRNLEHRVQMIRDEQTHKIPDDPAKFEAVFRLAGYNDAESFSVSLMQGLGSVHEAFSDLFPDVKPLSSEAGPLVFTGFEPGPETLKTLGALGYSQGAELWTTMSRWLGGRIPATRSERARELLTNLAPQIIDACAKTAKPDQAFFAFARFFENILGGVTLLSMFALEPDRLEFLIGLMSRSHRIADTLAQKPAILDAMADPDFLQIDPDQACEAYASAIHESEDFEDAMNCARRLVREDHFRVSAAILSRRIDLLEASAILTRIAECCVETLLPFAIEAVIGRGEPLNAKIGVIGLGKLGGRELSLSSDLDMMIVYEDVRSIHDPRIFTKITQRLISALSAFTEEGGLFEVDMALRPSGRSGPVAVSMEAFQTYYQKSAWTWEFMALSRGRIIAANSLGFRAQLDRARSQALCTDRPDLNTAEDIAHMLERTRKEKPPKHEWNFKNLRGGLRDLEYIAQSLFLQDCPAFDMHAGPATSDMLAYALETGRLSDRIYQQLASACEFYHAFRQASAIIRPDPDLPVEISELSIIAGVMEIDSVDALSKQRERHLKGVSRLTDQIVFRK